MSEGTIIEKRTTIHKVGGSMMITLPKSIAEALAGMVNLDVSDKDKKFHATIRLNEGGIILVSDIRERETNVGKKKGG